MNIVHLSEKYELNDLEKQIVAYMQENINELKSIGCLLYTSTTTFSPFCTSE